MIYLDSSVVLAEIAGETRRPDADFWRGDFVASELLRFEVWNRVHAYRLGPFRQQRAWDVLSAVTFVGMSREVLQRALDPFPIPVRSLDGLHLATALWLLQQGTSVELASYDTRLLAAAEALGISVAPV